MLTELQLGDVVEEIDGYPISTVFRITSDPKLIKLYDGMPPCWLATCEQVSGPEQHASPTACYQWHARRWTVISVSDPWEEPNAN